MLAGLLRPYCRIADHSTSPYLSYLSFPVLETTRPGAVNERILARSEHQSTMPIGITILPAN